MNILVTGACGLIGSHLCDFLLKQKHNVYGVDNLLNSQRKNLNYKAHFIKHDIEDPLYIDDKIDRIYHLACPASPIHYQKRPIKTILSSILGTYNLLEFSHKHKARFLYTSSSEVYGNTKKQPISELQLGENIDTLSDRSCYVEGKRAAETLIWNYIKEKELDVRIARLFNCYGPRMAENDGRVIANFIFQRPISIHGEGEQKRSFCYVDDTVDGLEKLMECENPKKPINIGNPSGYISIKKLAEIIFKLMGEELIYDDKKIPDAYHTIKHVEDRSKSEVFQRIPDISEAMYYLKWSPKVTLIEGLEKTIMDMKNNE
jgi:UDP-glucuronate decarboxylase